MQKFPKNITFHVPGGKTEKNTRNLSMKIIKQDYECDSYRNLDSSNERTDDKQHIYGRNLEVEQLDEKEKENMT